MVRADQIITDRLVLRRWEEHDLGPFADLNADPLVMEHFPSPLGRERSDELVKGIEAGFDARGFGLWALELRSEGRFIGFTGLSVPSFEASFQPSVEIGWRLARSAWGFGYATEAAQAALAFGFEQVGLEEVVSFTTTTNLRSQAVMHRIGMTHDPAEEFDHPRVAPDSVLCRHVLYRLSARRWRSLPQPVTALKDVGAEGR
jgi:RimJ/RimL family protein N-acetyltransferase